MCVDGGGLSRGGGGGCGECVCMCVVGVGGGCGGVGGRVSVVGGCECVLVLL